MAAMQCHIQADFIFMDAPYKATGEPDEGIKTFYPGLSYYEWYKDYLSYLHDGVEYLFRNPPSGHRRSLSDSTLEVLKMIEQRGPIDGILGFSQVRMK
jgi:hypothetical protein